MEWGLSARCPMCLGWRTRIDSAEAEMPALTSDCDPAGENPATVGRNYGLLRKEMRTCENCWYSARITFWVPLDGTMIYDAGDWNWPRAVGRTRRSGHSWRSGGNWPGSCISCGSAEKYTKRCMSAGGAKQ